MSLTAKQLRSIFDRTSGYCHLCHKKVSFKNRGSVGKRGAWDVDHSVPRSKGGSDHLNNLYAACISCNRSKQNKNNRSQRKINGVTRSPISRHQRAVQNRKNILLGASAGALLGMRFGPPGMLFGAILGAAFGKDVTVER